MRDEHVTPLESNDLLAEMLIKHQGRQSVPPEQEDLNRLPTEFLERLKEHQWDHLSRNREARMQMVLNLNQIEFAISLNAPAPAQGQGAEGRERSESTRDSEDQSGKASDGCEARPTGPARRFEPPEVNPELMENATLEEVMAANTAPHKLTELPQFSILSAAKLLPTERVRPDRVPMGSHSTVFVRNIPYDWSKSEIVFVLNSMNCKLVAWCNALSAVNIIYVNGPNGSKIRAGQVYAMYASPGLADLAVNALNGACLRGHELSAEISNRRCGRKDSDWDKVLIGHRWWDKDIYDCPSEF